MQEMNTKIKKRRYLLRFMASILLFWIVNVVYTYTWLFMYENIAFVLRLSEFAIIAVTLYYVFRTISQIIRSGDRFKTGWSRALTAVLFIVVLLLHVYFVLTVSERQTETIGIQSIISKEENRGKYYFIIADIGSDNMIRIRCDQETYQRIIMDEEKIYAINFRRAHRNATFGVLRDLG